RLTLQEQAYPLPLVAVVRQVALRLRHGRLPLLQGPRALFQLRLLAAALFLPGLPRLAQPLPFVPDLPPGQLGLAVGAQLQARQGVPLLPQTFAFGREPLPLGG